MVIGVILLCCTLVTLVFVGGLKWLENHFAPKVSEAGFSYTTFDKFRVLSRPAQTSIYAVLTTTLGADRAFQASSHREDVVDLVNGDCSIQAVLAEIATFWPAVEQIHLRPGSISGYVNSTTKKAVIEAQAPELGRLLDQLSAQLATLPADTEGQSTSRVREIVGKVIPISTMLLLFFAPIFMPRGVPTEAWSWGGRFVFAGLYVALTLPLIFFFSRQPSARKDALLSAGLFAGLCLFLGGGNRLLDALNMAGQSGATEQAALVEKVTEIKHRKASDEHYLEWRDPQSGDVRKWAINYPIYRSLTEHPITPGTPVTLKVQNGRFAMQYVTDVTIGSVPGHVQPGQR